MSPGQDDPLKTQVERDGFALRETVVPAPLLDALLDVVKPRWGSSRHRAGLRNLWLEEPLVRRILQEHLLPELVRPVLGPGAFPVRSLWFDKTASANWGVPWHQDLAIAVRERIETPGFTGWSVKDGLPHVHPPAGVLADMLAVRLHLDDCGPDNGPLRMLPGSHVGGRLPDAELDRWQTATQPVECCTRRGGAVLLRPLLLHASSPARQPGHRRVLHVEFARDALPGGLQWVTPG